MKPRGLMIAVVVLAALAVAIFISNKKQAAASKSTDSTTRLLSIPEDQFKEIQIKKLTGETIDLQRPSGKWEMTQPKPERADQDAVSSMVNSLSSLNYDKVVDESVSDLKAYGLETPTLAVQVKKKDGSSAEVLIGDDTPTGSGAYAKLPAEKRVVTISSFVKTSIDKRPDDLRDKRLLTFEADKLTRVELQAKGQSVEFGKNGANEWQIVKPHPQRADSSAVETLLGKLRDAKFDPTAPDADAPKKFAAAAKLATVSLTDSSGSQTMEVHLETGKDKTKTYYAKSTVTEGTYKIQNEVGDALDKSVDDFRQHKVFDFGFSDPTKIEVNSRTFTKSGDKWMEGSKVMDNNSIQTVIDRLRELSAKNLSDKPVVGSQLYDFTVTSNDGKRVEKVIIRQQDKKLLAQRQNEPTIYELADSTASDLQRDIGGIKEKAPEPPKKK